MWICIEGAVSEKPDIIFLMKFSYIGNYDCECNLGIIA